MKDWQKISLMLCIFGFLKQLRPSDPFIVDFYLGPWRNLTSDEINREILPLGTYSSLVQLVVVLLICDFLRYKPLIITMGLSGIMVWSILLWTSSKLALQLLNIPNGTYFATEVAYFAYIYAKVDRQHYLKISAHTRAAIFVSHFIASTTSQLLISYQVMDYRQLNYISLTSQICATMWAVFLPAVKTSTYFHREENSTMLREKENDEKTFNSAYTLLWKHFKAAYTNKDVLKWSIWYAVAMSGYMQVLIHCQVLWDHIDSSQEVIWNGAVDAAVTLLGTVAALGAGYLRSDLLSQRGRLFMLSILTIVCGSLIFVLALTHVRMVSYLGYIGFGMIYAFLITITSAEVAKHLVDDSFGLVFGINTLFALLFQTLLSLLLVSEGGLALSIVNQFIVYASMYVCIGIVYLGVTFYENGRRVEANQLNVS